MCCNKRRNHRATESAAAMPSVTQSSANIMAKTMAIRKDSFVDTTSRDTYPPHTNMDDQSNPGTEGAPPEQTYESVALEWLGVRSQGDRRPSFNSYHAFDTAEVSS